MLGCCVRIDHGLYQRVAGQSVATVQSRAGTLAQGIETMDGTLAVEIHFDAATHIVGRRAHGDHLLRDVNADAETFLVDVGEVLARLLRVLVGHVEADMVQAVRLHLLVDSIRRPRRWTPI